MEKSTPNKKLLIEQLDEAWGPTFKATAAEQHYVCTIHW